MHRANWNWISAIAGSLVVTALGAAKSASSLAGADGVQEASTPNQFIEVRTYTLQDAASIASFDQYANDALIPALNRLGIEPVGAFALAKVQPESAKPAANSPVGTTTNSAEKSDKAPPVKVMLVMPATSAEILATAPLKIAQDAEYLKAGAEYLQTPADKPVVVRISSEVLRAFDSWPEAKTPKQKTAGQPRIYELRTYESPTERLGNLKVDMFNAGEVPIFLDCEIQPVFMGQAVFGNAMPNLTYMTVYDDADTMAAGWKRFADHAEWKKLREVKKYAGTVSKIQKSNWEARPYSQL